ncbi:MAG TPA: ABC transporter substrate-binding protein [Sphingobium sp.]|uniref:ABC transporter substrate-binding protein n=1 Tax=Sphingobium sp. TaxID=1912891 RepID=UPI002ED4FF3F
MLAKPLPRILTALCAALVLVSAAPQRPRRVVSINMCTDQLVVLLADRSQIAGLGPNAGKAELSAVADKIAGLPVLGGSAEEILAAQPDLVIGSPATGDPRLRVLRGSGYRTVDVPSAESYAQILASIRQVAAALGHPERGDAMIAIMNRQLAALPRAPHGKVAAYYQRRGYMTGTGTLVDDLMTRVGLVNLATKLGKPALSQVSLEEMVAAHPDYLIMESATAKVADQGTEMLHHPALNGMKRLSVPQAWTVCGGPFYVQAAQDLARQMTRQRVSAR